MFLNVIFHFLEVYFAFKTFTNNVEIEFVTIESLSCFFT